MLVQIHMKEKKNFHFINRETDYHKSLTKALERIEDGTFGVCITWRANT